MASTNAARTGIGLLLILMALATAAPAAAPDPGRWERRTPAGVVEEYDPATDRWRTRTPMPTPRHGLGVAAAGGRVFALSGGPRPGGTYTNANEVYTPPR